MSIIDSITTSHWFLPQVHISLSFSNGNTQKQRQKSFCAESTKSFDLKQTEILSFICLLSTITTIYRNKSGKNISTTKRKHKCHFQFIQVCSVIRVTLPCSHNIFFSHLHLLLLMMILLIRVIQVIS